MIEKNKLRGSTATEDHAARGEVHGSIEKMIWDLEVELLEIIDPGYRAALERFMAGDDSSEAVVDPVRDPGEGIVG